MKVWLTIKQYTCEEFFWLQQDVSIQKTLFTIKNGILSFLSYYALGFR